VDGSDVVVFKHLTTTFAVSVCDLENRSSLTDVTVDLGYEFTGVRINESKHRNATSGDTTIVLIGNIAGNSSVLTMTMSTGGKFT